MTKRSIKIEGMENILAELDKKDADTVRLLTEGLTESSYFVRDRAKVKAPFRKGKLKSAIASGDLEIERGKVKIDIGIDTSVKPFSKDGYYARFKEIGTSKMRATPYLRPALDESKNEVKTIISKKLKKAL